MLDNPIARIRNSLDQLQALGDGGHLTPQRLRELRQRIERDLNEAAAEADPEEHFEITVEGLQALYVGGKPTRWRGGLCVIDGDRT